MKEGDNSAKKKNERRQGTGELAPKCRNSALQDQEGTAQKRDHQSTQT